MSLIVLSALEEVTQRTLIWKLFGPKLAPLALDIGSWLVMSPTSSSLFDLLYISDTTQLATTNQYEAGISDHNLVDGVMKRGHASGAHYGINDLKMAPWSVMDSFDKIDDKWDFWRTLFREIVYFHVLLKHNTLPKVSRNKGSYESQ